MAFLIKPSLAHGTQLSNAVSLVCGPVRQVAYPNRQHTNFVLTKQTQTLPPTEARLSCTQHAELQHHCHSMMQQRRDQPMQEPQLDHCSRRAPGPSCHIGPDWHEHLSSTCM